MLLFYFGVASLVAIVIIIIKVCTYDYTLDLDEKGKDIKDKIDDWLQI
ncbi:hypothetical protein ES704_03793 [subsurface metagenome]